jgi:hypothetical protein
MTKTHDLRIQTVFPGPYGQPRDMLWRWHAWCNKNPIQCAAFLSSFRLD